MVDLPAQVIAQPYADDPLYEGKTADFKNVEGESSFFPQFDSRWLSSVNNLVPCLSVGCLGNLGLHLLGNVDAYERISSAQKWLFFTGGRHDTTIYLSENIRLVQSFRECRDQIDGPLNCVGADFARWQWTPSFARRMMRAGRKERSTRSLSFCGPAAQTTLISQPSAPSKLGLRPLGLCLKQRTRNGTWTATGTSVLKSRRMQAPAPGLL